MPLLSNNKIQVVPVSLAKDGFTLKPCFQVDQNMMTILGGKDVYTLDYIKENPTLLHESFRTSLSQKLRLWGQLLLTTSPRWSLVTTSWVVPMMVVYHELSCKTNSEASAVSKLSSRIPRHNCKRRVSYNCVRRVFLCGKCPRHMQRISTYSLGSGIKVLWPLCEKDLQFSRTACLNLETDCQ